MSTSTQPTYLFLSYSALSDKLRNPNKKIQVMKQLSNPNTLFAFACSISIVGDDLDRETKAILKKIIKKAVREGRAVFREEWLWQIERNMSYNKLNTLLTSNGHNPIQAGNFGSDNIWLKRLAVTVAIVGIDLKKVDDYENYDYPEATRRVSETNPHITCV